MRDPVMIRRDAGGMLRSRLAVNEMRFEGVAFINLTQLFSMVVDAGSGIFVFSILNTVPRQRAEPGSCRRVGGCYGAAKSILGQDPG